jgi:hypothetical protein
VEERLFDTTALIESALKEVDTVSAGRRRTILQKSMLRRGIHPLTRRPLLDAEEDHTCGDCLNHEQHGRYHKCRLKSSFSEATDIRISWPACELWRNENS